MKNLLSVSFALLIGSVMLAQTVITGTVKDKSGNQFPVQTSNLLENQLELQLILMEILN